MAPPEPMTGTLVDMNGAHLTAPDKRTLLVVEDDAAVRRTVRRVAEDLGWHVNELCGLAGLGSHLAHYQPDLVVLDLSLEGSDGVEVLKLLAGQRVNVPVQPISGLSDRVVNAAVQLGRQEGLDVLAPLHKPFALTDLRAVLSLPAPPPAPEPVQTLEAALSHRKLSVDFEPQICLRDRSVIGAEARVKWRRDAHGPPSQAVSSAEPDHASLVHSLTHYVLDASFAAAANLVGPRGPLRIAVELSAEALAGDDLSDMLESLLTAHAFAPERLVIHVPESVAMADVRQTSPALTRLAIRGVRLCLSEFGSARTNVLELARSPFHEVLLARDLVAHARSSAEARRCTSALVATGRALELDVCAGGVPDQATLDLLVEVGCDCAQGPFIAPVMPAARLALWVAAHT